MRALKRAFERAATPAQVLHGRALSYFFTGPPEIRLLKRLCRRDRCSIDIGANLGVFSYFMRRYSTHVYAYEPNPDLASALESALGPRVSVVRAGLSNEVGEAVLSIPTYEDGEMHGLASLSQDFAGARGVRQLKVEIRRLDDEGYSNVGFVKIDVEQHEAQVIEGAMDLFARDMPNLLVEVTPLLYENGLIGFLEPLLKLGYKGSFLFAGALLGLDDYDQGVHNREHTSDGPGGFVTNIMLTRDRLTL